MIEGIASIAAVSASTPSAWRGTARRQKRLNWLSSLRAALDETGSLADARPAENAEIPYARAQIDDALDRAEDLRQRNDGGQDDAPADAAGRTITATELARRIAAAGDRSLAAQAHIGAAAVRRYVVGTE